MSTVDGHVTIQGLGIVRWKVKCADGSIGTITTLAHYVPNAEIKLLSPQHYSMFAQTNAFNSRDDPWTYKGNSRFFLLNIENRKQVAVPICSTQNLPMMVVSHHGSEIDSDEEDETIPAEQDKVANYVVERPSVFAQAASSLPPGDHKVLAESNQNLNRATKRWLLDHQRLGHLGFRQVEYLYGERFACPRSKLPKYFQDKDVKAEKVEEPQDCSCIYWPTYLKPGERNLPRCIACCLAKAKKRATPGKKTSKDDDREGVIKRTCTQPGEIVSTDFYHSAVLGRNWNTFGKEPISKRLKGGTIFFDHYSGLIRIYNQIAEAAGDALASKWNFERDMLDFGHNVKHYHSDNGVYASQAWVNDCKKQHQTMSYCGPDAHHQNAMAERGIQVVVWKARTLMIHASLLWPDAFDEALWPMALDYAAWLYNHTPTKANGELSPMEKVTGIVQSCELLKRAFVWGAPAYVLEPDAGKGMFPTWKPRAFQGQFLGFSNRHSTLCPMVRSIKSGKITPCFHVVIDQKFETVASNWPEAWEEVNESDYFRKAWIEVVRSDNNNQNFIADLQDDPEADDILRWASDLYNRDPDYNEELAEDIDEDERRSRRKRRMARQRRPDEPSIPGDGSTETAPPGPAPAGLSEPAVHADDATVTTSNLSDPRSSRHETLRTVNEALNPNVPQVAGRPQEVTSPNRGQSPSVPVQSPVVESPTRQPPQQVTPATANARNRRRQRLNSSPQETQVAERRVTRSGRRSVGNYNDLLQGRLNSNVASSQLPWSVATLIPDDNESFSDASSQFDVEEGATISSIDSTEEFDVATLENDPPDSVGYVSRSLPNIGFDGDLIRQVQNYGENSSVSSNDDNSEDDQDSDLEAFGQTAVPMHCQCDGTICQCQVGDGTPLLFDPDAFSSNIYSISIDSSWTDGTPMTLADWNNYGLIAAPPTEPTTDLDYTDLDYGEPPLYRDSVSGADQDFSIGQDRTLTEPSAFAASLDWNKPFCDPVYSEYRRKESCLWSDPVTKEVDYVHPFAFQARLSDADNPTVRDVLNAPEEEKQVVAGFDRERSGPKSRIETRSKSFIAVNSLQASSWSISRGSSDVNVYRQVKSTSTRPVCASEETSNATSKARTTSTLQ